jgi:hypothetical protein
MNKLFGAIIATLLIASPAVVAVASLPDPIVYVEYDKSADFAKYRSYSWVPPGETGVSQADYERARTSVDRALAPRFNRAEPGDFAIAISGTSGPKGEYRGSYQGVKRASLLVIDIYDTSTKAPFWHGVVRAAPVDLDKAIDRLVNYFPPSRGCPTNPLDQRFSECSY